MARYEQLKAWQHCHELALSVYGATDRWPRHELFGLTSQARRAAHSAAANIAEGFAKRGPREFRRYLDISLGSLAELSYTLRLARDLSLLTPEKWTELNELHENARGLVWLLYRSLHC
ncbi:MAG: four helix bundle protein [Gemmatimonadales bacterium]